MRLSLLVFTAALAASPAWAQTPPASPPADAASPAQDHDLPVNLDRIRGQLVRSPTLTFPGADETPTFKIEIQEKQKIEELVAAILKDVKKVPVPAGGIYMQEMWRQWWPASDHPEMQPYGAFNQGELTAILAQSMAVQLLAGLVVRGVSSAGHAISEYNAREEVRQAILEYCAMQPDHGAAIHICRP